MKREEKHKRMIEGKKKRLKEAVIDFKLVKKRK